MAGLVVMIWFCCVCWIFNWIGRCMVLICGLVGRQYFSMLIHNYSLRKLTAGTLNNDLLITDFLWAKRSHQKPDSEWSSGQSQYRVEKIGSLPRYLSDSSARCGCNNLLCGLIDRRRNELRIYLRFQYIWSSSCCGRHKLCFCWNLLSNENLSTWRHICVTEDVVCNVAGLTILGTAIILYGKARSF